MGTTWIPRIYYTMIAYERCVSILPAVYIRIGLRRFSDYALMAEVYTDRVGKNLATIWFPDHKYTIGYKYSKFYAGMMFGYYIK